MKRRLLLLFVVVAIMVAVAALALQPRLGLLVIDWANKAPKATPPVAVLIEFGGKDTNPVDYSGTATVTGAKIIHREGYRFRKEDKLVEPNGWVAGSHRGLRVPPKMPAISKMEAIATAGVVLHLADVADNAVLTITPKDGKPAQQVPLKAVLSGQPSPIFDGLGVVRLVSTATPVAVGKTEDDFPAACYGPDGTLWVAYISYTNRVESRRIEQKSYLKQPENFKDLYIPGAADQLFVKAYRGGKWSEPLAITGAKEDLARCAIAAEGNGTVWVVYSAKRKGPHQLYGRPISTKAAQGAGLPEAKLGKEERLHERDNPVFAPVMCTDQAGTVWLTAQGQNVPLMNCRNGVWHERVNKQDADFHTLVWYPALAAGPGNVIADAHDGYGDGSYDIGLTLWDARENGMNIKGHGIASTSRFETRPSMAYDPKGRLWIAYEDGPPMWGKDYGSLDPKKEGNPLYTQRSVRVVCIDTDGKLKKPAAELPTSVAKGPKMAGDAQVTNSFERSAKYAYPKIGIDGKGRVWLTYRRNFGSRYSTHAGSFWVTFARRLDGDKWSEPIEVHHSDGLLDHRPVLLPHNSGGLLIVHNTDGRYNKPETIDNQVYMSTINLPGEPVEPKLVAHDAGKPDPAVVQKAKDEAAAVKRMRGYRVKAGGKTYQLLRGEYHRHTEISWDGGADGSLEDMWRYAIDAAALDWIGNGDHDNGAGREYSWWLTQKFTDAYHVANTFTPLFTYERSVAYPHGHRNVMFAQRGVLTLPRLKGEKDKTVAGIHADDTKMLYRYLHEHGGICAVHTSATSMGTDWRDNDPKVEPIVEIYQGDRMSYEKEGRRGPAMKRTPASCRSTSPAGIPKATSISP